MIYNLSWSDIIWKNYDFFCTTIITFKARTGLSLSGRDFNWQWYTVIVRCKTTNSDGNDSVFYCPLKSHLSSLHNSRSNETNKRFLRVWLVGCITPNYVRCKFMHVVWLHVMPSGPGFVGCKRNHLSLSLRISRFWAFLAGS